MDPATPPPFVGDRVVVRYRLDEHTPADWRGAPNPATAGPTLSDVTGVVDDLGDRDSGGAIRLRRRHPATDDDVVEAIPYRAITSLRVLSRTTVRNSEIRDVLRAATEDAVGAQTGQVETEWIDGWFVVAAPGTTPGLRLHAASPLDRGARATPSTRAAIAAWYARRDMPATLCWPARLLPDGARPGPLTSRAQVLTMPAEPPIVEPLPPTTISGVVDVGRISLRYAVAATEDRVGGQTLRELGFGLHHELGYLELADPNIGVVETRHADGYGDAR